MTGGPAAQRITTGVGSLSFGPDPVLVGVINVTPDSFSDSGEFFGAEAAVAQARALLDQGAHVVDVGGESTRPGSDPVSPKEELRRILPVIRGVLSTRPDATISVDTYRYSTARSEERRVGKECRSRWS